MLHKIKEKILDVIDNGRVRHFSKTQLLNKDVSLICNNCVGGHIYHDLGLKFLSPTINLAIPGDEFVNFSLNLEMYLKQGELKFGGFSDGHPMGVLLVKGLPDIHLNFRHDFDFEKAKAKWIERSRRVNYRKLYFLLIRTFHDSKSFPWLDLEKESAKSFLRIDSTKKILVDSWEESFLNGGWFK